MSARIRSRTSAGYTRTRSLISCRACASVCTWSWAALRASQTPAIARPSTMAYTTPIIMVMYSMTSGVSDGSSSAGAA